MRPFLLFFVLLLSACGSRTSGGSTPTATGPAAYFMALFAGVAGNTAPDSLLASFDVQIRATPTPAVSTQALRVSPERFKEPPMWRARNAFDRTRAQLTDRAVARGRNRFLLNLPAPGVCTPACDPAQQQMCWNNTCTSTAAVHFADGSGPITCNVVQVLPAADTWLNVLLDQASDTPAARVAVLQAATGFAKTFANELKLLGLPGHTGSVDRDGDGRMTVVFTNNNGNDSTVYDSLVGFFSVTDFLDAGTTDATGDMASGNVADLLWVRVPGTTIGGGSIAVTVPLATGTMAHEYTHLASFGTRVQGASTPAREVLWLDEGIAHTMEDLTGWGVSNVQVVQQALRKWDQAGFAGNSDVNLMQRGRAYTLVRYLVDQQAHATAATDAASDAAVNAAAVVIGGLLHDTSAQGYGHSVFQNFGADGLFHWLLALYVTGNPDANRTDAHASDYLSTSVSALTGNLMGFDPHGSYQDAAGNAVVFQGPSTTADLDASSTDFSVDDLGQAASHLYSASGYDASQAKIVGSVQPFGPYIRVQQVGGATL